MLFRVKTQQYVSKLTGFVYKDFHHLPVGSVFHSAEIEGYYESPSFSRVSVRGQYVPLACFERIPNTKANLRKFAKGLL